MPSRHRTGGKRHGGQENAEKELDWIVGDGTNISVWDSPWLSMASPQAPIGPPNCDALHLKVSDLILQTYNSWYLVKIRQYLPQYGGQIRQIFLSPFMQRDCLVWLNDRSRVSKTGYNLSKSNLSPINDEDFKWWDNI